MTIRNRLLVGYGLAFALIGVVLVWAVINLVSLGRASDAILRDNYQSIRAAAYMLEAIENQDNAALLVVLGFRQEGISEFRKNETVFLQWLARAQDNVTVEGETDVVTAIEKSYSEFLVAFSQLSEISVGDESDSSTFYRETLCSRFETVRDACRQLREVNQGVMFDTSARAGRVAQHAILSTIGVGVAAIVVGVVFGLQFSSNMAKPLLAMTQATESLAKGSYDVHVEGAGSDELQILASGFNTMAEKLHAFHDMNVEEIIAEKLKNDAVLQSISDGILVVDAEFRVINANPVAARLFSTDPRSAEGKHFLEIVHDQRIFDYVKEAAKLGRAPGLQEEERILTLDIGNGVRHFIFTATPVRSNEGAIMGVVLLLSDVTRLRELDQLKSDFVMTASHELRTPLTGMEMSLGLLMEKAAAKLTSKEQELLSAAHEDVLRLKALVNDLLDLSRIESGQIELQFDHVPLPMLLDRTLSVFEHQIAELHITLACDVPPDLPEVRADPNKITWVLVNLISNAIRYLPQEDGHIGLRALRAGTWVHVSVQDNGKGIPQDQQARIFDKFVQVPGDQSARGTGLGLAICKEIVRAHRGVIWVESTPGKGSTFTFTLPVAEAYREVRS